MFPTLALEAPLECSQWEETSHQAETPPSHQYTTPSTILRRISRTPGAEHRRNSMAGHPSRSFHNLQYAVAGAASQIERPEALIA